MTAMILLGAGFSHNWGGWLAKEVFNHLIGLPEIRRYERLTKLLWQHQSGGGFEDAIAEVQRDYRLDPARHGVELKAFQDALGKMFADMNDGYAANPGWEFQQQLEFMVRTFLVQFEVIFSLNQDLLLEQKYLNDNIMLGSSGKWGGWQIPGMKLNVQSLEPLQERATGIWSPSASITPDTRFQPLYKLHGSVNWRDGDNQTLIIIGGNKAQQIQMHPILNAYAQEFDANLMRPEARLMIIGYGFRDHHINRVIAKAVYENHLQFFVICPEGAKVAEAFRSDIHPGAALTAFGYELNDVFAQGCVGISTRKLSEIFGTERGEHASDALRQSDVQAQALRLLYLCERMKPTTEPWIRGRPQMFREIHTFAGPVLGPRDAQRKYFLRITKRLQPKCGGQVWITSLKDV